MLSREQLYQCEQEMIDAFGYEDLYNQLSKAMCQDDLEDYLAYIARVNDFKTTYEMKERS